MKDVEASLLRSCPWLICICIFFLSFTALPARAQIVFQENFESGGPGWTVGNGVWEIGTSTAGPASCLEGTQCAGTVAWWRLNG